ncbi:MAG: Npt1/Npt2 family nucleotide transporter [Chromatiales bacterium]
MNSPPAPATNRPDHVRRAVLLFANFLLIILAYYQIKPASRSLFVGYLGTDKLPYVWIGTAVVLGLIIGFYHRLVAQHSRLAVVLGSLVTFTVTLILFRYLFGIGGAAVAVAFYIFVDIFSVVIVEQFWSLTNTIYTTEAGKRWYGFVAAGGLVGGVLGGKVASGLLKHTGLTTEDLLLVAAGLLVVLFFVNLAMSRLGIYRELPGDTGREAEVGDWQLLLSSRYLLLIAAIILLSQLVEPIVEYQFLKSVELAYHDTDPRTAYLSDFFALLGTVAIAINLGITPLVHRYLGVMAGLVAQPLMVSLFSIAYMMQPTLMVAGALKIGDRGLSYSINRASKELLYIPIDPVRTYQAKAWIDMFGYRLFKVIGSVLILALTQWFPLGISVVHLSYLTLAICAAWLAVLMLLTPEYRTVSVKSL